MIVVHTLLVLLFCLSVSGCQNNNLTVTLSNGKVRGLLQKTAYKGTPYYSFRGIPYAQPPIGKLRFKPPVEKSKWNGTLDATKDGSQCVQSINPVVGSEDCLFVNVYTPSLKQDNLSVLVFIHGGGFIAGNSSYATQPPDLFLDENLVFVMFNYRLGIFGFLSTEDLVVPGNNGLKDQVLALKWIQNNIHHFGGNPAAVTIFGQSAGAASVSYLMQSPSAKGLFKAAIMDSGTSLCLWALNRRARRTAFAIGRNLFLDSSTTYSLVNALRDVNYVKLQQVATVTSNLITLENPLAGIMFGPVIEPYHDGAFFYNKSEDLLRNGAFHRVPALLGINSNEVLVANDIPGILKLFFVKYDINVELIAPEDLTNDTSKRKKAAKEIKSYFFGSSSLLTSQPEKLTKFLSSDQFNRPIRKAALDMRKFVDVYFYEFSYVGLLGRKTESVEPEAGQGVGHAEELGYLFTNLTIKNIPQSDTLIQKQMVQMWTNFAKYNNPTPTKNALLQNVTWLPAEGFFNDMLYLNIDIDLTIARNPFEEDMKFYDTIYQKYGTGSYDTY